MYNDSFLKVYGMQNDVPFRLYVKPLQKTIITTNNTIYVLLGFFKYNIKTKGIHARGHR